MTKIGNENKATIHTGLESAAALPEQPENEAAYPGGHCIPESCPRCAELEAALCTMTIKWERAMEERDDLTAQLVSVKEKNFALLRDVADKAEQLSRQQEVLESVRSTLGDIVNHSHKSEWIKDWAIEALAAIKELEEGKS